jgi:hypothetical protein
MPFLVWLLALLLLTSFLDSLLSRRGLPRYPIICPRLALSTASVTMERPATETMAVAAPWTYMLSDIRIHAGRLWDTSGSISIWTRAIVCIYARVMAVPRYPIICPRLALSTASVTMERPATETMAVSCSSSPKPSRHLHAVRYSDTCWTSLGHVRVHIYLGLSQWKDQLPKPWPLLRPGRLWQ